MQAATMTSLSSRKPSPTFRGCFGGTPGPAPLAAAPTSPEPFHLDNHVVPCSPLSSIHRCMPLWNSSSRPLRSLTAGSPVAARVPNQSSSAGAQMSRREVCAAQRQATRSQTEIEASRHTAISIRPSRLRSMPIGRLLSTIGGRVGRPLAKLNTCSSGPAVITTKPPPTQSRCATGCTSKSQTTTPPFLPWRRLPLVPFF
mmetsp:Transcript_129910/g.416911  ORF Transcript_129910/g.416911 Transcript_129910/m.416911 type:complete len:200 (+) Transcript_129910:485-1084(+)